MAAFNAETGSPEWFTHVPTGVALAPAIRNGTVVVTAMCDSVYGLSTQTGQRLWALPTTSSRYDLTAPICEGNVGWVSAEPRAYQIQCASGNNDWMSTVLGNPWFPYKL